MSSSPSVISNSIYVQMFMLIGQSVQFALFSAPNPCNSVAAGHRGWSDIVVVRYGRDKLNQLACMESYYISNFVANNNSASISEMLLQ